MGKLNTNPEKSFRAVGAREIMSVRETHMSAGRPRFYQRTVSLPANQALLLSWAATISWERRTRAVSSLSAAACS
jgi:hypothetical protein